MDYIMELAIDIIEKVEDLMEKYDVTIESEDRIEAVKNEEEGVAPIYGEEYYTLEDNVIETLESSVSEFSTKEYTSSMWIKQLTGYTLDFDPDYEELEELTSTIPELEKMSEYWSYPLSETQDLIFKGKRYALVQFPNETRWGEID